MDRSELVSEWAGALAQVIYIARSRDEIERELANALDGLVDAWRAKPFSAEPGARIAQRLVELGLSNPECLESSVNELGRGMPRLRERAAIGDSADRLVQLFSAMARGFGEGMRRRLFDQQEDLTRALIRARENAERALEDSEARFEEIFSSSSVGMAISTLDGALVRFNRALADILDHRRGRLAAERLEELFHPEDAEYLRLRYQVLLEEDSLPFRERRRLLRADGEEALVFLSASVLRDPDGTPRYYVTSAEDVSDKHFLEGQLQFQAIHDALTGLVNRHRFLGLLEESLNGKERVDGVTVFHLDLDGFRAINNGMGRQAGDRLLQSVATKLRQVFDGETATIARFDGDEFGVLLVNTLGTPSIGSIAAHINDELAEPIYLGDEGIAATATIAVVHRPHSDTSPEDLLRATDTTLQRLKSTGRRQWGMVDLDANERDQTRFQLAGSLPGAWESGEIRIEYQPLVSVRDKSIVAVQALLCWDHAVQGTLDHGRCLTVLADTGLSLPIGKWLLSRACTQLRTWTDRFNGELPKLYLELSPELAGDPDLVATVRTALADAALDPGQLQFGMPVSALRVTDGLAEENMDVLVDLGIAVVLYEFGTTRGDLACLEDLPVRAVKMSPVAVSRVDRMGEDALFTRSVRQLVPLVRDAGIPVMVGDIASEAQYEWWRAVGAEIVQGDFTGTAGSPQDAEHLFVA
ncbi:MAG: putative bifunctional diguanylate cyclase/phosphodiesterase [Actinophytocola sp.]|uniref:putative bifunctional diguanylate cyclase/phosphodiesterase n=1 Tax=Actinophytocola sp. TaxID=1872138 RepID=UPI003D6B7548